MRAAAAAVIESAMASYRFIDIGANLTDPMYDGFYNGTKKHEADLECALERCWNGGMDRMILTGGSVHDSETALRLANTDERLYITVGCHPTRCNEFQVDPVKYLDDLRNLIVSSPNKAVAIGECGLDYDRIKFCSQDIQKNTNAAPGAQYDYELLVGQLQKLDESKELINSVKYFECQLTLSDEFKLPLFLHCRAAWDDFFEILSRNVTKLHGGVIHSFDGSMENMHKAIQMGFYIGINGCSLKTEDNLKVASEIPSNKLLMETDCPWCEIRPTHASSKYVKTYLPSNKKEKYTRGCMVKGRNEPVNIRQVLEVLAAVRNEDEASLCSKIFNNTVTLFFNNR